MTDNAETEDPHTSVSSELEEFDKPVEEGPSEGPSTGDAAGGTSGGQSRMRESAS